MFHYSSLYLLQDKVLLLHHIVEMLRHHQCRHLGNSGCNHRRRISLLTCTKKQVRFAFFLFFPFLPFGAYEEMISISLLVYSFTDRSFLNENTQIFTSCDFNLQTKITRQKQIELIEKYPTMLRNCQILSNHDLILVLHHCLTLVCLLNKLHILINTNGKLP